MIKYTDLRARRMDRAGELQASELPPTACGSGLTFFLGLLVLFFAFSSMGRLSSEITRLKPWGDIALNVDHVCPNLRGFKSLGITMDERNSQTNWTGFLNADPDVQQPLPQCHFNELYYQDLPTR